MKQKNAKNKKPGFVKWLFSGGELDSNPTPEQTQQAFYNNNEEIAELKETISSLKDVIQVLVQPKPENAVSEPTEITADDTSIVSEISVDSEQKEIEDNLTSIIDDEELSVTNENVAELETEPVDEVASDDEEDTIETESADESEPDEIDQDIFKTIAEMAEDDLKNKNIEVWLNDTDGTEPVDKAETKAFVKAFKAQQKQKKSGKLKKYLGGTVSTKNTAQDTLCYQSITPDGICQTAKDTYNKTISFGDINYRLAKDDVKDSMFTKWCDLINSFDDKTACQLTFINQIKSAEERAEMLEMPMQGDKNDKYRAEYNRVIREAAVSSGNKINRSRYITFAVKDENKASAAKRLDRLDTEIRTNLKSLGVQSETQNGYARLKCLHDILNPDDSFDFNYAYVAKTGLSTQDFIAPTSFNFRQKNNFEFGNKIAASSYLQIQANELGDDILAEMLEIDQDMIINIHLQAIDQTAALNAAKAKISNLETQKIDEQKKAVKSGYDMDILPPTLITAIAEAKSILEDLQQRDERMYMAVIVITNIADNLEELKNQIEAVEAVCNKYNCKLKALDYQQEPALISSLPLGINELDISRQLTTSAVAVFMPFVTQELNKPGGIYYGRNAISGNIIRAKRTDLKNPNGLILGTPGSGKSFTAKREMIDVILRTKDEVSILDPEREYAPLISRLGGEVVVLSVNSKDHINPFDIELDSKENDPVKIKADFVLSLVELISDNFTVAKKAIIDRCVHKMYANISAGLTDKQPKFEDLYNLIKAQPEQIAQDIALDLELYVNGSLDVFNHDTNIDSHNRVIAYDIKELGRQLRPLAMMIIQENVWNRVSKNREGGLSTWYYIDEFHLQLKQPQTANYSVETWKRFRKWDGIPTGITQNVKDLLASPEIENIFENTDFIIMLNQSPGDRKILAEKLDISESQLTFVTDSAQGEGLLKYGACLIPFYDKFPKDTELYKLMTTNPEEIARYKSEAKKTAG